MIDEMEDIESKEESESKIDYVKIIKEGLLFYTTAFFVLLLICRLKIILAPLKFCVPFSLIFAPFCVNFYLHKMAQMANLNLRFRAPKDVLH